MRKTFLMILIAALPALALAQQPSLLKPVKTPASDKLLPLKGTARNNSCAEYGAGFNKVEGTDTCVKAGGYVSVGVGSRMGAR
jgi:Porin subfamily